MKGQDYVDDELKIDNSVKDNYIKGYCRHRLLNSLSALSLSLSLSLLSQYIYLFLILFLSFVLVSIGHCSYQVLRVYFARLNYMVCEMGG